MTHDLKSEISHIYGLRQSRAEHPDGKFDKAGRWYPSDEESQDCCDTVRSPSRGWPYSLMLHCRTRKHITQLVTSQHLESCSVCRLAERLDDDFSVATAPVVEISAA